MNILHNNLEKHLIEISSPFTIVETLGYLAGFASSNCPFESYNEGLLTYFSTESDPKSKRLNIDLVRSNIDYTQSDISHNNLILFFEDENKLSSRLMSLSDWSRNFMLSISYLIDKKLLKNTLLLQEILHDFSEISKISNDYQLEDDEESQSSYEEISNYVVASSYDIYNESKNGMINDE
tara:strand:+ start:1214 stop:1753 length:540 start_codon:yes stop_codon:yes gene_type:complete